MARFESGQAEQIVEHVLQRSDTLGQHVGDFEADRLRQRRAAIVKQRGGTSDDGHASAKVVSRHAPRLSARALQDVQGRERGLQIVDMAGRLRLMEPPVLRRALRDAFGA